MNDMSPRPGALIDAPLLLASQWSVRLFSNGWRTPQGGVIDVLEPASETVLTRVGRADRFDVAL
ncbi:MAG TPA: hypothetical protein VN158_12740, partial [Caulobacter sp.]|nr:hypothetical protein [Caulobacter sp.]